MRHHVFNALVRKHGWKPARVAKDGDVIQFDVLEESILTSEELDFFGYMRTFESASLSRKAPVGMTKAVSLEKWEGDMAFYANHDLVQRAREIGESADPNPFSKEEHLSLYKYSVVVDLENIGKEKVIINEKQCEKLNRLFGIDLKELKEKESIANDKGTISLESVGEKSYRILVTLNDPEKQKRLKQFFDIIINGFEIHSSTESWCVSPVFIVIATTRLPVTLFNPYIKLDDGKIDVDLVAKIAEENTNVIDYRIWGVPFILKGEVDKLCKGPKDLNDWVTGVIGGKENS